MNFLRPFSVFVRGRGLAVIAMLTVGLLAAAASLALAMPVKWTQVGADIEGTTAWSQSGTAISLSADGSRIAISSSGDRFYAGQVRIFDAIGTSWVQVGDDLNGAANGELFGSGLSLSADGSRVAIGAPDVDSKAGRVRVFEVVAGAWVQVGGDIGGKAGSDFFGQSVSLSADGSRLAAGALGHDGVLSNAGQVQVFDLVGGVWVQVGGDIDGEAVGERSGSAVSLSADGARIAVGAFFPSKSEPYGGQVRVFDLVGSSWVQVGERIDGFAGYARSLSLSADGSHVSVGAEHSADRAGRVRVFSLTNSTWVQVGLDLYGVAPLDRASVVSLSATGSRLAVGAPGHDGANTDAGGLRVFDLIDGAWVQVGQDIDGAEGQDLLGSSVGLSADGSRVATGAIGYYGVIRDVGRVQVFDALEQMLCVDKVVTIDMNLGGSGVGTPGDDVILGTPGDDVIDGGAGNDTVCAGEGDDVVVGGTGDDVMFGGPGDDVMRGNAGADSITGGPGNDRLLGGIDNDDLSGGPGNDYLGGFGGEDVIRGGDGNDTVFGGFGADTIDGDAGNDVIRGLIGDDIIRGGDGNDMLYGDRGNDTIDGNAGDDTLYGGNANDVLSGDDGNDMVNGGKADDALSGGLGTDTCAGNKAIVGDTTDGTCETIFSVP